MRGAFTQAITCLVAAAATSPLGAADPLPSPFGAEDVLARTAKTYVACTSYRDRGLAEMRIVGSAGGDRTFRKGFTTVFVRPDRFRHEYTEAEGDTAVHCIVWRDGRETLVWSDLKPGVAMPASFGRALAEAPQAYRRPTDPARALSLPRGPADAIPALLFPKDLDRRGLSSLNELTLGKDAKIDNSDCFCIDGKDGASSVSVWVDAKTFLVRRIATRTTFDDCRTVETTTYTPVIDEAIPESSLRLQAPREK
jgi:hypothetical protein